MDIGALVGTALGRSAPGDPRGTERFALSPRLMLPLLQSDPALAGTELGRDLRQALNAADARLPLVLVLPAARMAESAAARLEVGGRFFSLPASLRDALLAALEAQPGRVAAPPLPALAAAASDPLQSLAWTNGAHLAAALSAGPAAPPEVRKDVAARNALLTLTRPLLDDASSGPAAARLRAALEHSGLFFESHLAQWAGGSRATEQMRAELLHIDPRLAGSDAAGPSGQPAQRVAAQLAVLQQQAVTLEGAAWAGQAMALTIARDPQSEHEGAPPPVRPTFQATLRMELPGLGPLEVRLRLAGEAIAATVVTAAMDEVLPALDDLAERLQARGLSVVSAQAVQARGEEA
jgi:hypothetical protein